MRANVLVVIFASLWVNVSYANATYPMEFTDFFVKKEEATLVTLLGDGVGIQVKGLVSYDEFQLKNDDSNISELKSYFRGHQLSGEAVDEIIHTLLDGVSTASDCRVSFSQCAPSVGDGGVAYVFDYDNSRLKVFVDSRLLSRREGDVSYHAAKSESNALVNQSRLYSYADEVDGHAGVNLSNLTTMGLPYGYLQFNTQYQSSGDVFDVYKGVYDLEVDGVRAVIGYSEKDRIAFNTTDFLTDDADYAAFFAQLGSSRNLVRGGERILQELPFFSPQSGQLEVYQGERLLLTRVVGEGRHAISYSDLPSGTYSVRLVLRAGGQILIEETRQVVNTRQFGLPVGGFDYVMTVGQFESVAHETALSWLRAPGAFEKNYGQARAAWRLTDRLLLGGAFTTNQDSSYAQMGGSFAWNDWLTVSYQAGVFDSKDTYQALSLGAGSLFITARQFTADEGRRDYRLSSKLYGERSFKNYSATYSTAMFNGSGYLTYTHYGADSVFDEFTLQEQKSDSLTLGWSSALLGGQLGVSAGYTKYGSYDDVTFGLYWSHSLGESLTGQLSVNGDKSGVSRAETGLTHNVSGRQWSGSTTASTAWVRDDLNEGSLSGITSGEMDWFNASAYGYINTTGRRMVSGTLTGSQFISMQGYGLTNERSASFIHVVPRVPKFEDTKDDVDAINLEEIQFHVRRGARSTYRGNLLGADTVIPLTPFTNAEFSLDADQLNLSVEQSSRREFVYPGTVYSVSPHITPLVSQLYVLNDMYGEPISHARCVGDACNSIERVSDDGVFRVNYRAGEPIKLMSINRLCINSPELKRNGVIYTFCLPGLDGSEQRIEFAHRGNKSDTGELIYLGKFNSDSDSSINALLYRLKEADLHSHSVEVGKSVYLYVENKKQLTLAQRQLLDGFDAYIVRNDADLSELFSVR